MIDPTWGAALIAAGGSLAVALVTALATWAVASRTAGEKRAETHAADAGVAVTTDAARWQTVQSEFWEEYRAMKAAQAATFKELREQLATATGRIAVLEAQNHTQAGQLAALQTEQGALYAHVADLYRAIEQEPDSGTDILKRIQTRRPRPPTP